MRFFLFAAWLIVFSVSSSLRAQDITAFQIIRGVVIEKDTRQPLPGVAVIVDGFQPALATATDIEGKFRIQVPVGRRNLRFRFIGFEERVVSNIVLNTAKEVVLEIELLPQAVTTEEIVVSASKSKEKPLNEMSAVSARTFNIEEAQRYASSVNDPGRMAAGFAGVSAPKDNNNDIVVRGNSPVGVLWRLEGIDIPNPNHFARKGSTGGGISILSATLLENGDFSTGAFAAEYGNAFAAVFDLRFRKGNNEKREYTARAGLLGLDIAAEGPFKKGSNGGASYLVNYRYSTLGLLNKMGFRLVGENVENNFQDLCFNVALPTRSAGVFTIFGIGGLSDEIYTTKEDTALWEGTSDYTYSKFTTTVGAIGATHTIAAGKNAYVRTVCLAGGNIVSINADTLNKNFQKYRINSEYYGNGRYAIHSYYYHKLSNRLTLKSGLLASYLLYNMNHNKLNRMIGQRQEILNGRGGSALFQPYAQIKIRTSRKLSFTAGVHGMHFLLNGQTSLDPRLGIQFDPAPRHGFSLGYGIHHQIQPLGNYLTSIDSFGTSYQPNRNLRFTRADHYILGYDFLLTEDFHIRAEFYYQYLRNIPTGTQWNSTYNILNERDGYARFAMLSNARQLNRGIDLTFEKFFSRNYFFLSTVSIFESRYRTYKDIWYNTRYNTGKTFSGLFGKEISFGKHILELGTRMVYSGGLWYTPFDLQASAQAYEGVRDESRPFSVQTPDYFRTDIRIAVRINKKGRASVLGIDVQNVTARKNVFNVNYDVVRQQVVPFNQAGLIPVISWKMEF
jgi:hypothetical protein